MPLILWSNLKSEKNSIRQKQRRKRSVPLAGLVILEKKKGILILRNLKPAALVGWKTVKLSMEKSQSAQLVERAKHTSPTGEEDQGQDPLTHGRPKSSRIGLAQEATTYLKTPPNLAQTHQPVSVRHWFQPKTHPELLTGLTGFHRSDLFPLFIVVFCLFSVSLLKPEHTWNPAAD